VSDNPYSPPGSKLADPRLPERRRPLLLAALAGLAVDIGGTFLVGSAITIVLALTIGAAGGSPSALQELLTSPGWTAFNFVSGMTCTALGGYVAARIANQRELLCGLVVGGLSLAAGEFMLAFVDDYPIWLRIASILVVIPAGIAGGWLRKRQRHMLG